MTTQPLIEIRNMKIRRNSFLLSIPEFNVTSGQVVGVVGPNGAGKTTLLEAIAGLRPVDSGTLSVLGHVPVAAPEIVRSRLGFMNDTMPLFALKIGALLKLLSGYYPTWDAALVNDLLQRFDLDPGQKVHQLSKGQGTRIRLVTAMAFRPDILILDEPAAGLDLAGRRSLLQSVMEIVQDTHRSVIISSHGLSDIERIADQLLVVDDGNVVHHGPMSTIVGDTQTLEEAMVAWRMA